MAELGQGAWDKIARLPRQHREKVLAAIGKQEFEKCAESPLYWLDASQHFATARWPSGVPYVFTKDPHQIYICNTCGVEEVENRRVTHNEVVHGKTSNTLRVLNADFTILPAIRPFTIKEYMPPIVEAWLTAQYFAVEKSRDMMATWLMVALHTWGCMFHSGRQAIFQSEDASKTLELVQRSDLIYRQTPKFLRDAIGRESFSKGNAKSGELYFIEQESEILGFPQGTDQIRQFHPWSIFADEAAFQAEAGASFAAAKPAIMEGGRYSMISSANRSWFEEICRDRIEEVV